MSDLDAQKIQLIMDLRREGISDLAILNAIERVPREIFVPETFREHAYDNRALPIASGQTISQPFVVAYMTAALELTDRHKVLEIGTGSGYQAAVLARLCRRVYTVERHMDLLIEAEQRFKQLDLHTIVIRHGDGTAGWAEQAPFDRIMVTAAAPEMPTGLAGQLADGGIMVVPVGPDGGDQVIIRLRRTGDRFETTKMLPVRFVPLVSDPVSPRPVLD
ncbi:MAG: protein-L-isoaspartate(D-aspartate) O-methyltransferase [Proteobacteria bacterium]|nr:protein-L-isoaspartate(D-aspartate) O-methyltransferase [Pseudomonadota bacterium]